MSTHRLNLHLVSDATGETLNAIVRATTVQFEQLTIIPHRWSLIRTRFQLHRVLDGLQAEPGPVLSSLVDKALRSELDMACAKLGVPIVHVLDQVMSMLQDHVGEQAAARPGRQYTLDADYFRRIDAIHYVLAHDDGQAQAGIAEADVVLVGVSRSSKTPTSFYLANRGIKAGNIPLVPGIALPQALDTPNCPVVGLTLDPQALIDIRRHRLRMLGTTTVGHHDSGDYTDHEAVTAELLWAKRLCTSRGWPVIDVSRRSIEETAATIIQLIDAWRERQRKAVEARKAAPTSPPA
jgi:regulator of PEP synthase PpsR (kinase-PPPase family)